MAWSVGSSLKSSTVVDTVVDTERGGLVWSVLCKQQAMGRCIVHCGKSSLAGSL